MSKKKSGIILAIIVLLTAILTVLDFASFKIPGTNGLKKYNSIGSTIGLGIDLKGGYYAVLTPKATDDVDSATLQDSFDSAVDILRARLDNKGYTEATITIQGVGADREIRVEVPEVEDPQEILDIIGSTGELTFEDEAGTVYLTGSDIKDSQGGYDNNGQPIVYLEFTQDGIKKFSNATGKLAGQIMYIKLGGEIISQPTVNEQITNSTAEITGLESFEQAESIAAIIKAGKLKLEFEVGEANRISATLGENALSASVLAGIIGIVIIFAILIIRYRGLGIAASLALLIYCTVLIVLLAIVPLVELTLPGIAGIILSIGMAVDANIIIFERIKEEYKSGKTVAFAVRAGFKRAFVTILDGNVTTILAAIVLWILCPGSIKGFAITLFMGVVLSMITAIWVTRGILNLLMNLSSNSSRFFNLKKEVLENEED